LPELDGCDTIRIIREVEQFKNLPIIAVTAASDEREDGRKCPRRPGASGLHPQSR